jgi:hypothetical protein
MPAMAMKSRIPRVPVYRPREVLDRLTVPSEIGQTAPDPDGGIGTLRCALELFLRLGKLLLVLRAHFRRERRAHQRRAEEGSGFDYLLRVSGALAGRG